MARINVYLPDDLAAAAKAARLSISALTQEAVRGRLAATSTDAWLAADDADPSASAITHDAALAALDAGREEAATPHG